MGYSWGYETTPIEMEDHDGLFCCLLLTYCHIVNYGSPANFNSSLSIFNAPRGEVVSQVNFFVGQAEFFANQFSLF